MPTSSSLHPNPRVPGNESESSAELLSVSVTDLPEELLAEIFSYGCAGPDDYINAWIPRSNLERARASFLVATVCRRWRAITLNHAALWHYLTIPNILHDESDMEWLPSYVDMVLHRSRDAPIDVIIHFLRISSDTLEKMEPIFVALERNSHRWRRFAVVMYGAPAITRVLSLLTQPTPNLQMLGLARQRSANHQTLSICRDNRVDAEESATHDDTMPHGKIFLPDTSVLSTLSLVNLPQVVRLWNTGGTRHIKLQKLTVIQRVLTARTWDLLARVCADIKRLQLLAYNVERSNEPLHLVFPKLDLLWIDDTISQVLGLSHFHELTTPVLRELIIDGQFNDLSEWLQHIRLHLRHIDFRGLQTFDESELAALVSLEQLEVMQFSENMFVPFGLMHLMGQDRLQTEAAEEISLSVAWPRLGRFELYGAYFEESEQLLAPQLERVARMRACDGPPDEHGVARWVKLKFRFFGACCIGEHLITMMREAGAEVRVE